MSDELRVQTIATSPDSDRAAGGETVSASAADAVHDRIAAQAATHPEAIAVVAGSEILSYADLEARANQLGRYLSSIGVGPDQVVALYLERSPAMVVTALAVLKAGGAYLPLDVTLPLERLAFILRDADVRCVVTRGSIAQRLPAGASRVVNLDQQAGEIASFASGRFRAPVADSSLAYVIYTSGSTGQPKGVEIEHASLSNLVDWHCRAFEVTRRDRASQQAALGFDAAVWEIWPYLAAGASVYIPGEACRNHPEKLRDWLVSEQITITFLPSPLTERMLLLEWPAKTALRILLTGADTLQHRPSSKLPFTLINNYGPTECTVVATSGKVESSETSMLPPSIGRPIDNIQTYILDEQMLPVPVGTVGELYLGGIGLARGYRGQPELTRQKFIANPFSREPGSRLYRTGDLARQLANGEIEFLGRIDEQIKIRGHRIEPNEIVRVLDEHDEVETSVVVARENPDGEKSILAYVLLAKGATVTATALREHLRKQVPDYMVPAAFVRIETLPLTNNGKTDRAALPSPNPTNLLSESQFVAPRGPVEERLASIIASLLHVPAVGANDNFFLLGGHSLLGTQLISRINQVFGVELPLLQLFDHPTLAEMSGEIEKLILAKLEITNGNPAQPTV